MSAIRGLLPVLFLALLTLWSGTFPGGATFAGAAATHASLLGFSLLGCARWRDPLGLGGLRRWLVPALLLVTLASWLSSPVPRAGVAGLVLLPAFLLIPAAVARCWKRPADRRLGLTALGLLLGIVAALALARWQAQGSMRAAMPLGHHNLLATWLLIVWPLGLASLARRGAGRVCAAVAGVAAVGALAATGSFLALWALVGQALVAGTWWKRARPWLALAVLIVWIGPATARQGIEWWGKERGRERPAVEPVNPVERPPSGIQRAGRVAAGTDSSLRGRVVYARAGWEGLKERPLLGWGPASVAWTLGRFLEPVTGLNPSSEVVGDLHSWPLQVGYEIGALGAVLVATIVWLFFRRRWAELAAIREAVPLQASLVGLVGGGVMLCGNAPAAVLALPAALAVVAGAALGCSRQPSRGAGLPAAGLGCAYLLVAIIVLVPFERAHLSYQRAVAAETPAAALVHVREAHELDPEFPLYQARAAWAAAELSGPDAAVAEEARRAAAGARHLAPLWLAAGVLGMEAGRPWAEQALQRARELDPLSPLPVFHLLRARPNRNDAVELGAAAVSIDRRLGRAVFWDRHPELHAAVFERLGLEAPGNGVGAKTEAGAGGSRALLVQSMDSRPALAFSLYAFRRSPWPADIAPIEVRQ